MKKVERVANNSEKCREEQRWGRLRRLSRMERDGRDSEMKDGPRND